MLCTAHVIDTQRLPEEHRKQLLRDGFILDEKRFETEKKYLDMMRPGLQIPKGRDIRSRPFRV